MIGLGVSSIGDSWYGFAQNVKTLEDYYQLLEWNELPVYRGHLLDSEDLLIRKHILNLMCTFTTSWNEEDQSFDELPEVLDSLYEMEKDGLLIIQNNTLSITEPGKAFVRNICMAFDLRLKRRTPDTQLFSMTI